MSRDSTVHRKRVILGNLYRQEQENHMRRTLASMLKQSLLDKDKEETHGIMRDQELHPASEKITPILSRSRLLLTQYAALSKRVPIYRISQLDEHQSEEAATRLQDLLMKREIHVQTQVWQLLSKAESSPTGQTPLEETKNSAPGLWEELLGSTPCGTCERPGVSWAVLAKQAKRGVRHLVKCLPEGE